MKTRKMLATLILMTLGTPCLIAKTKTMTLQQYELQYRKIDHSLIGIWEKVSGGTQKHFTAYCQFNADGSYIAYLYRNSRLELTGKGMWKIENGTIFIFHGGEQNVPVQYMAEDCRLVFGKDIYYVRPAKVYASR